MLPGMNPTEAAEAALAAGRAHNDPAIWITRLPDAAVVSRARALEAEGPQGRPLWGVPFAVKDTIDMIRRPVAGWFEWHQPTQSRRSEVAWPEPADSTRSGVSGSARQEPSSPTRTERSALARAASDTCRP
jgi:hypothetical protein